MPMLVGIVARPKYVNGSITASNISWQIFVAVIAFGLSQAKTVLQLSVPEWNPICDIPERSPGAKEQL